MCGEAPLKNKKNVEKFEEIAAFVLARSSTITLKYEVHSDFIYSLIVWIGNLNGIELGMPYIEKNCIFKDSVPIMGGRVWGNPNSLSSHKLGHIFQGRGG